MMDNERSQTLMKKNSQQQSITLKQHFRRFPCAEKNLLEATQPKIKVKKNTWSLQHGSQHWPLNLKIKIKPRREIYFCLSATRK